MNIFKKLFSSEGKVKDVVCGMMIDANTATYKSRYKGVEYFFCSENCKHSFDQNPSQYI